MATRHFTDLAIAKAAYLASTGSPPTAIAELLKVWPSTVTGLLKAARSRCWLQERLPHLAIDDGMLAAVKNELFSRPQLRRALVDLSKGRLIDVVVFNTVADSPDGQLVEVAERAANYIVSDVIPFAGNVAITWGKSVRALVIATERLLAAYKFDRPKHISPPSKALQFIQGCGDPTNAVENPSLRSSSLVAMLNAVVNAVHGNKYTFSMAASIPKRFNRSQVETIREFLSSTGGYSEVFNIERNRPRLKVAVDTLITSCGNGKEQQDRWVTECAECAGIKVSQLEKLTVGNIGGYWLPKSTLTKQDRKLLDEINDSWNGIGLADMQLISQKEGIVLVASEPYKAEILLHLVGEGLISRLLVGQDLATRMELLIANTAV